VADEETGQAAVERILHMVSEGKITPEQGAELLRALPGREASGPQTKQGVDGDSDGFGRFREGRRVRAPGSPPPPGAEGVGFDLAQLGRIGRQVARRVEREIDHLERSARRGWFEEGDVDDRDDRPEQTLWTGPAPADGQLVLDVDVDNASVRVDPDPEATEVTILYRPGFVRGFGSDFPTPRAYMDAGRLVVRQRHRGVIIGLSLGDERITVRVPPAVTSVGGVVQSQNGAVRLDGPGIGRLAIRAANGAARVRSGRAEELEVHSTNGRVEVLMGTARTVRASSRNGKVEVAGAIGSMDADAGNGKLVAAVGALTESATWRLSAGNGKVEVHLPPAPVGLQAQVRSAVGGVDADIESATVRWLGKSPVGAEAEVSRAAGPGAPTLSLEARATNGRISLSEDDSGAQAAASV
jgi:hypothetical protein